MNAAKPRRWTLAHGRTLDLGEKAVVMGILNVTPDSFSDGGRFAAHDQALAQAERMIAGGAEIIDVGGESTRPDAMPVPAGEEQARVLPVIEALAKRGDAVLSVDTYRAETARLALEAGAHVVNDIWGLQRDPGIAELAVRYGAGLVLMHNGRERAPLPDVVADQFFFLDRSLAIARQAGIRDEQIVLDPGFGFAKNSAENIELVARFEELLGFGLPLLTGASRKRFIGRMTGRDRDGRDPGTAAVSVVLRLAGCDIFRVHDVAMNKDALGVADAILAAKAGLESR